MYKFIIVLTQSEDIQKYKLTNKFLFVTNSCYMASSKLKPDTVKL